MFKNPAAQYGTASFISKFNLYVAEEACKS